MVGAGLAGLMAARTLKRANKTVCVLEAADHVGGRMVRKSVIGDGYVDLGGQWVGPTQDRILALMDELKIEKFPSHVDGNSVLVFDDRRATFDDDPLSQTPPMLSATEEADAENVNQAFAALVQSVVPESPWDTPNAAQLDTLTLAAWLDANATTAFGRQNFLWEAVFNGAGGQPSQVSLLHSLFEARVNPEDEHPDQDLLVGGAGQIPPMLAAELGDSVVVGAAVRRIDQDDKGVTVSTDSTTYRAGYVIVAMPPQLTGRIAYHPPLPVRRQQLAQGMSMGTLSKVHCVYDTAFWRDEGMSGTARGDLTTVQVTADSSPPSGRPGILTCFPAGVDWTELSPEARRQAVLDDYVRYFGPVAANPAQYIEEVWPANPLVTGAYNAFMAPGVWTSYGQALRDPVGRIYWAGTETAKRWYGYFDGAVRSGEDAAAAILAND